MNGLKSDSALVKDLVRFTGLPPSALAKSVKLADTTLSRPYAGTATTRLSQRTIEKLQAAYPGFPGWAQHYARALNSEASDLRDETTTAASAYADWAARLEGDDSLAIPMIELAYGMGGTFLDDVDVGETVERFPRAFVRMFTNAPASQLVFAHGIGDSMAPTIGGGDLLLIDRSRDAIRINDQIWAVALGGIGMVKRVRVESGGQVTLLSDNSTVPPQHVTDDELIIIGRVIAVVNKL